MSVCVTHIQNEPLSTVRWGDERWTEASRTPLAYSLPPSFLSLVSLPVFHSLPCSLPCWAVNLTDVENKQTKKKKFVNINNVSPRLSVFACAWEQEGGSDRICACFGRRAMCDRAYTWCIYTLFVSLSRRYAAEVKAGCDDPARWPLPVCLFGC